MSGPNATLSPMADTDIGRRLKEARERAGYETQAELADAIGVRPQSIYRIETAGFHPGRATTEKLAKALKVTEAWLLYGLSTRPQAEPETPESVEEYLSSEFGSDTPTGVAKRLRGLDYNTLGVPSPTVKDVHRLRELIEHNLRNGRKR